MILGLEVALLFMGIMALSRGKLTLTKQRVVYGTPAHLLGVLACAPLPLSFMVGMTYARMKGNVTNPPTDSVRWTLVAIEASIVLVCLAAIYIIGWQFTEDPAERYAPSDPDMPPPDSSKKTVLVVLGLGVGVFAAVLAVSVLMPDLAQRLGMGVHSVEADDADIDALPAEPSTAGPVPEFLLPEATKPALDRLLNFHRRTLAEAYDAVGKRNSQWDEHAHLAMELAARDFSDMTGAKRDGHAIHAATQKALDAGCDDALVLYLHYRFAGTRLPEDELERGFAQSARSLQSSSYPQFRRGAALHKTMDLKAGRLAEPSVKTEMARLAAERLRVLLASARTDEHCEEIETIWLDNATGIYSAYAQLGYTPRQSWQHIDKTISAERNLDATRNSFRGWCNFQWANDEKGRKGQEQEFGDYYTVARDSLEKSWQSEPTFATAHQFLQAEIRQPRGRTEMEKWFEHEMQHRPRVEACYRKLDWLSPKRHGTKEDVLEFGRTCRDSKNWECGIPLAVVYAHQMIGDNQRNEYERKSYLREPEVATDILYVLAKAAERDPDNVEIHSLYAYYCYRCGHLRRAQRQYEQLGDKLWWGGAYSESMMKNAREKAKRATR